jgi:hypothetical protein
MVLPDVAIQSVAGRYCTPAEAKICNWSGEKTHPDDIRICEITGLAVHFQFSGNTRHPRLQPLAALLDGARRTMDATESWDSIATHIQVMVGSGRCTVGRQFCLLIEDVWLYAAKWFGIYLCRIMQALSIPSTNSQLRVALSLASVPLKAGRVIDVLVITA